MRKAAFIKEIISTSVYISVANVEGLEQVLPKTKGHHLYRKLVPRSAARAAAGCVITAARRVSFLTSAPIENCGCVPGSAMSWVVKPGGPQLFSWRRGVLPRQEVAWNQTRQKRTVPTNSTEKFNEVRSTTLRGVQVNSEVSGPLGSVTICLLFFYGSRSRSAY